MTGTGVLRYGRGTMTRAADIDVFDLAALRAAIAGGWQQKLLFFWRHRARSAATP